MLNAPGPASHDWEITPEKVEAVIRRIIEVGQPLKLILFGSYVRGEVNVNSDLDVLIITRDNIINQRKESVRIRRALHGIFMPIDIIVVPERKVDAAKGQAWHDLPGSLERRKSRL